MRAAISLRTAALCWRLNSGSVSGVIVYSTASLAIDSRIASYWRVPMATLTAGLTRPTLRSIAGRRRLSIIQRVRSDCGP